MPTYCFECECGNRTQEFRIVDKRNSPIPCELCDGQMLRSIAAEHTNTPNQDYAKPSELWSIAPNTPAEREQLVRAGAEFGPGGVPLARNRAEKLRLLEVVGYVETK